MALVVVLAMPMFATVVFAKVYTFTETAGNGQYYKAETLDTQVEMGRLKNATYTIDGKKYKEISIQVMNDKINFVSEKDSTLIDSNTVFAGDFGMESYYEAVKQHFSINVYDSKTKGYIRGDQWRAFAPSGDFDIAYDGPAKKYSFRDELKNYVKIENDWVAKGIKEMPIEYDEKAPFFLWLGFLPADPTDFGAEYGEWYFICAPEEFAKNPELFRQYGIEFDEFIPSSSAPTTTAPQPPVTQQAISVTINGESLKFDQPPVVENGRTLVPLRAIFEALGAEVDWDSKTRTVIATKDDIVITLEIGSDSLSKNNEHITLDVPAKIINGSTMVPARAV